MPKFDSRKIKAKVLQENHRRMSQPKVKEIPPRRFEETLTLEEEVRSLGDFEIGEDELLPKLGYITYLNTYGKTLILLIPRMNSRVPTCKW